MPTTLLATSAANALIRFKEPYVSDGLNRKNHGVVPAGIHRGGLLETANSGFGVNILAGPNGDSVYAFSNVSARQLTYRENGTRLLDLAAVANTTVFVCLHIEYSTGALTEPEWRAYTQAELDALPEAPFLVIVGKVVVPAGGPIAAASVTRDGMTPAWKDQGAYAKPWNQIVQNGNFHDSGVGIVSPTNNRLVGFRINEGSGSATTVDDGTARTGAHHLTISVTSTFNEPDVGPARFLLADPLSGGVIPVVNGQLVDASMYARIETVLDGFSVGQGLQLVVEFYDRDAALLATHKTGFDPAVDTGTFDWRKYSMVVAAPDDGMVRWYVAMKVDLSAGTGKIGLDSVSVLLEPVVGDDNDGGLTVAALKTSVLDIIARNASDMDEAEVSALRLFAEKHATGPTAAKFQVGSNDSNEVLLWLNSFVSAMVNFDPQGWGQFGSSTDSGDDADTGLFRLIAKFSSPVANVFIRIYSSGVGFAVATGAYYDPAAELWVADDINFQSNYVLTTVAGVARARMDTPSAASWTEAAWDFQQSLLLASNSTELEYATVIRRTKFLSLFSVSATPINGITGQNFYVAASTIPQLIASQVDSANFALHFGLDGIVPGGANLIDVQMGITVGSGTGITVMSMRLYAQTVDDTTTPIASVAGTLLIEDARGVETSPFNTHMKLSDASGGGAMPTNLDYSTKAYWVVLDGLFTGAAELITIKYIKVIFDDRGPGGR